MTLAIYTVDERGLSNEARHELLSKKSTIMLRYISRSFHLYITNKMERFSFKSGLAVRVAELIQDYSI